MSHRFLITDSGRTISEITAASYQDALGTFLSGKQSGWYGPDAKLASEPSNVVTWTVFSLDMWGHVSADCLEHHCETCVIAIDCETCNGNGRLFAPVMGKCEACKGTGQIFTHDDNACDCHEDCNQQFRCGEIQIFHNASDAEVIQTMLDDGFLTPLGATIAEIDDYGDGSMLDVNDKDGRRLFHLQRKED